MIKNTFALLIVIVTLAASAAHLCAATGGQAVNIELKDDYLKLVIRPDARVNFIASATGADYADPLLPIAHVKAGGKLFYATAASYKDGLLTLRFGETGISATIAVTSQKRAIGFEVRSVTGPNVDELTFCEINLKLKGSRDEPFTACILALDLQTNVPALPGPMVKLSATCYKKLGMVGAKAAIIGCPPNRLREVMQEVVSAAAHPELLEVVPHSSVGGPWALDSPANRTSYLFNFGELSEQNVDAWIKLAKDLGIPQIDFHGGGSFRFGDCRPNPKTYPKGRASFKAVIDKLHAAGILAGLHTYAFFLDKGCPWVTPVPDPGLAKDATFTLADAISAEAADVAVSEDTKAMSATTGFFVRNSITLQIDDELITYSGISKSSPYAFTKCGRGAYGTKAQPHAKGAKVHHLKECFGLFAPDPDSPLFTKLVEANADFYNECGFDMVYLDALDGEDVLGGGEWSWHYGSKFVFELFKRLKKAPIMEMSTFHHHLWYVRSRMGAWDHPNRSHKRFIDLHCSSNESCLSMFLPAHLGWWSMIAGGNPYTEPTFSDDIEYLCAKCAGWDCGLSPQGFTPESYAASYNLRRLGGIIRRWEDLRLAGWFTEPVKARLREPGREFTLAEENGKPRLLEVQCTKHKVTGLDSPTSKWSIENRLGARPARLRIEALMSAKPYDSPGAVTVISFQGVGEFDDISASDGVGQGLEPVTEPVKAGGVSGCYTAFRTARPPEQAERKDNFSVTDHAQRKAKGGDAAWSKMGAVFSPPKDLSATGAFGVWVYGDGRGELLNLQYRSPEHMVGGLADNYITIDFTGWRYFELIEPEGERVDDYTWPYGANAYAIYRELVHWNAISRVTFWLNDLPADGVAKVCIAPVKALPLIKAKLVNPSIAVNGKTITFPVELESGCYIEYNSASDCKLYSAAGDLLREVTPQGSLDLKPGTNEVSFTCTPPEGGASARANVTVMGIGAVVDK